MRTNYAGFAVTAGMGLVVLLLGLLGLSAAGLTNLAPGLAEAEAPLVCGNGPDSTASLELRPVAALVVPAAEKAVVEAGETLFKNNCYQCHAINEKVVGPALAGLTKRRSAGWVVKWVQNSSKVIASGDEYAVKLFNDNGKQQMPAFPQLSDKDIQAIIAYLSVQEGAKAVDAEATLAVR